MVDSKLQRRAGSRLRAWLLLAAASAALCAFAFGLLPALAAIAPHDLMRRIEEREIEADALFYSDTPQCAEACNYLRNRGISKR